MFTVILAKNVSETIAVSKTITTIVEVNGVLRDETSIINPDILIEATQEVTDAIPECNYLIVPEFNRSYFVKDISSYRNTLYRFSCHVDVLVSFANEIKLNKGIVHRQEHNFNLLLNDGVLKAYQDPLIGTLSFPQGFSGHSNVLLLAGNHGGGVSSGAESGGAGNTNSKTTAGLVNYASAQIGLPYWYGTFGNIASQSLYDSKRVQYPDQYTDNDFTSQFGQRVHDCVGLIKGYRWCDEPTSVPVYVASQDVDVSGLWSQCTKSRVQLLSGNNVCIGSVVFTRDNDHCGVYIGSGVVIEARSHAQGVIASNLSDRNFLWAGVPQWCQITTGYDVLA